MHKGYSARPVMNSSILYLVRHGETIWNQIGRQQGHLDSPLTTRGIEQARAAGRFLHSLLSKDSRVSVETSPLGRARQTAIILCDELHLDPADLVIVPLLIEHDLGSWQGLTYAEIDCKYPGAREEREANKWHYVMPNGESYARLAIRAKEWLSVRRTTSVTIAVTHEMLSRTIQGVYGGLTPAETLGRSHRHDRIYKLYAGKIEEFIF